MRRRITVNTISITYQFGYFDLFCFLLESPDKHLGKWLHFDDPTMVDVVASELVPTKLEAPKFMWKRFQIYGLRNTVLVEHTPK